ncbi:MAG: carboxypeptidase-like regulatory domain-containing protein [Planctomycetaceae bacterium]|nr:carboxypeptidase-like regulatory domain-containing protein [Planctomycetaceae bacterium]
MQKTLYTITILTAFAMVAGCGNRLGTINVTGTVTFDGQPLAGANVNFSPQTEGEGLPAFGVTDANGRYVLQTLMGDVDAGTTPGTYLVTIIKMEQSEVTVRALDGGTTSDPFGGTPPPPRSVIPERYNQTSTSGFTATVERGSSNVFDFDLTR